MSKQIKTVVQKPRLGRGLSSLIGSTMPEFAATDQEYQHVTGLPPVAVAQAAPVIDEVATPANGHSDPRELAVADISPNPYQPRREFKAEDLQDLCQSIIQQGVLQPLIVAPSDRPGAQTTYVLIAGERRLRAAKLAGLASVPCVIRHATKQQMIEWALVENIQRSDLNPLERALAYREYMDRFNLTQAQGAERLGEPRATVANYLRILELADEVQKHIASGALSFGHAKVLAGLAGTPQLQLALAQRAVAEGLSVRQVEALIASSQEQGDCPDKQAKPGKTKLPYVRDLEEQLTKTVGTKVMVVPGRARNTGRIVVEYYCLEDFDRISGYLGLKLES